MKHNDGMQIAESNIGDKYTIVQNFTMNRQESLWR